MKLKLVFILVFISAVLLIVLVPFPQKATIPVERDIRIEASQFAFTPAEINVNQGDRINIDLVSTDVVHGMYIDGYGIGVVADPGKTAHLSFFANQSGSFRLRCNITCGAMHPFMIGKLHVGQNVLLWRGIGLASLFFIGILFFLRLPAGSIKYEPN